MYSRIGTPAPASSRRRRTAYAAAAAVVVVGLLGGAVAGGGLPLAASLLAAPTESAPSMAVSMSAVQKMTWAASKPSLGLRFAQNMLSATGNTFEGTVQSVPCAEQVKVVTANLQMHWVNATSRPAGSLSVGAFERLFAQRVGDHGAMDIFLEFNIGFFVVDLDYFAGRLEAHGYSYLALRWHSQWDNATYYSVVANVPGTTTVVEFVGAAFNGATQASASTRLVDPARYTAYFADLGAAATAETYVCVKLSFPSTYPDYASLWMRQYMTATEIYSGAAADELRYVLTLEGESFVQWHWVMYPPSADASASKGRRSAHEAVQEWEDYLSLLTSHTVLSPNCGFNQYLDFHPGIYPNAEAAAEGVGTLDDILYQFARDKVNFRLFHAWDKQHLYANASNSTLYVYYTMPLTGRAFQLIGTASNPWFRKNTKAWTLCDESCTSTDTHQVPTDADSDHLPAPPSTATAGDVADGATAGNVSAPTTGYVAPPSNTSTPI